MQQQSERAKLRASLFKAQYQAHSYLSDVYLSLIFETLWQLWVKITPVSSYFNEASY